jgi:hypothetical protein
VKWNYGTGKRVSQLAPSRRCLFPFWNGPPEQISKIVLLWAHRRKWFSEKPSAEESYPRIRRRNFNESNHFPQKRALADSASSSRASWQSDCHLLF